MAQILQFKAKHVDTVVDQLNRMDGETLDVILHSLFETNEDRAADISRTLEILALDKAIGEGYVL